MPDLYDQHFVQKQDERRQLFEKMAARYEGARVLYPGSFIHLTPAFYFPEAVFVDSDRRAAAYFKRGDAQVRIRKEKLHDQESVVRFHAQDFSQPLPEDDQSFDLLLSQYAGFISQDCKRYLRLSGFLLGWFTNQLTD